MNNGKSEPDIFHRIIENIKILKDNYISLSDGAAENVTIFCIFFLGIDYTIYKKNIVSKMGF